MTLYAVINIENKEGWIFNKMSDLAVFLQVSRKTLYNRLKTGNFAIFKDFIIISDEIEKDYSRQRAGKRSTGNLLHVEKGTKRGRQEEED